MSMYSIGVPMGDEIWRTFLASSVLRYGLPQIDVYPETLRLSRDLMPEM